MEHKKRRLNMAKVYNCIDCGYADTSNTNWRGYIKCEIRGIFVDPNSNACYRAIERPTPSSNCYITTTMCSVLNYSDDCKYLKTLRDFRDKYMKYDPKCLPLLLEYDKVGPLISQAINQDKQKETVAKAMFDNYIIPAVCSIEAQDYDQALELYVNMTDSLRNHYGISPVTLRQEDFEKVDYDTLGKSRVRFCSYN